MNHPGGGAPTDITPPAVTFSGVRLADAPSERQLAAFICPEVVSAPAGTATAFCEQMFGERPDSRAMNMTFDLRFHITNPNGIPLSVASVLTALTLFPATPAAKQGAACLSLCPAGATGCAGAQPGACEASKGVRSLADFAKSSASGFVIAKGLPVANGERPSFVAPQIVASSDADITARYSLEPEQLLALIRQLAAGSGRELAAGRAPHFSVPYRYEGTIWFDSGSSHRIAVAWGPSEGSGALPLDAMVSP